MIPLSKSVTPKEVYFSNSRDIDILARFHLNCLYINECLFLFLNSASSFLLLALLLVAN